MQVGRSGSFGGGRRRSSLGLGGRLLICDHRVELRFQADGQLF
jgi:hypothetical protein